jgi:anti-sigma regulatory factor (Ser/Thr protein kinase)
MRSAAAAMAEITLRTDLSELTALADFVDRFAADAALPADAAFQLNLVLEELVTNTIIHGQVAPGDEIHLRLERRGDVIEADLVDTGAAFDPRTLPAPELDAPLESRSIGGLGVHLVRQFVDELDYRRENDRNHLRLRKRVSGSRASGSGGT